MDRGYLFKRFETIKNEFLMKFCIDIALRGSTKHLEFLNSGWLLILAAGTDLAHVLICLK